MKKLVKRSEKVAFYGITEGASATFVRMTGFTDISVSKNPKEYARQYVDEEFEQSDVVGYSPSISFGFDQYEDNAVHADIAAIADGELLGNAAVRPVVIVDLTEGVNGSDVFVARKRDFAVIPDSEGNSTDAYTYSGNLKAKSSVVTGTAVSTDGWKTCTFSE